MTPSCSTLVKKTVKAPKVRVVDVEIPTNLLSDRSAPLATNIRLAVSNPNGYDLEVSSIAYSATLATTLIARGESREKILLPAEKTTEITVPVTILHEGIIEALKEVLARRSAPYEFNGSIGIDAPVVGTVRIPFSKTGEIDPLELLRKRGIDLRSR